MRRLLRVAAVGGREAGAEAEAEAEEAEEGGQRPRGGG